MTEFSYGQRLLGQFGGPEQDRVTLLASGLDPSTFAVLESLGVAPGWRCLEVGAGAGTVSRWLADRVAPATVVAVDRDVRFLGQLDASNLEVRELDLTTSSLPEAAFELVFARVVLLHLPGRDAVLERLSRAVAPGGYLVIGETAPELGFASAYPEIAASVRAITDSMTGTLGTDHTWFRSLPGRLAALGLTGIGVRADTPPVAGGGDLARSFQLTLDAVSETALRQGLLDEDTLGRAAARLADPGYLDLILTLVHTWGRRPSRPR